MCMCFLFKLPVWSRQYCWLSVSQISTKSFFQKALHFPHYITRGHDLKYFNQSMVLGLLPCGWSERREELSDYSKSPSFSMKKQQCGIFLFSLHILLLQFWKVLTSLTTDAASLSCILFTQAFHANKKIQKQMLNSKLFLSIVYWYLEILKAGSQYAEIYWSILKLLLAAKKPDRENKVAAVFLITETNIIILSSHWNTFQNTANY